MKTVKKKTVKKVRLGELCHSRSGDKGNIANIGLILYDPSNYEWVKERVTVEAVRKHFEPISSGPIERYELPKINALNFVLHNALGGGISGSLKIDAHGKGFSAILLEMEIEAPPRHQQPPTTKTSTLKLHKDPSVRLGSGSAAFVDRLDAPLELAKNGKIDYLIFDSQSEKQFVEAAERKAKGGIGYDLFLERKLRNILPDCLDNGVTIISNGGSADVPGAVKLIDSVCKDLGLKNVKIVYFLPDNILDVVQQANPLILETGKSISTLGNRPLAAQAYQSASLIVEALQKGADIVLTSRAGDATQFLAPLIHEFNWPIDDWNLMGKGLGLGHLMECAGQISGGYYADPGQKDVPNLARIGFPIAEVQPNGNALISKLPGTGGEVSEQTCREQLLYELHNPGDYKHNDGVVDFTTTEFYQTGPDQVLVTGTTGHPRPETVKIFVGVSEGFTAVGRICYGGTGAFSRAKLASDIVTERMSSLYGVSSSNLQFDFIGVNALYPWKIGVDPSLLKEVELRIAGYFENWDQAMELLHEVEHLSNNGPFGLSMGMRLDYQSGPDKVVGLYTTFLPQENIQYQACEAVVGIK